MILVFLFYAAAAWYVWTLNIRDIRVSMDHINSTLAQGVRTTFKGHELILRGFGSELVSLGALVDPEKGRPLIERMNSIDPGIAGFGLARTDGQLVLVSGIGPGQTLPNLSQRAESKDSFADVLRSRQFTTGRPYYFKALKKWVIPIRTPLFDDEGKMIAVMTAGYDIERATTAWSNQDLPRGMRVLLVRNDGYVIFVYPLPSSDTTPNPLQFAYASPVREEALKSVDALAGKKTFTLFETPRLTEKEHYLSYDFVEEYGLHAGVLLPKSQVIVTWLRRMIVPTLLFLAFLVGGSWAFLKALRRQERADAEITQLTAWQQAVLNGADYSIISTDIDGRIVSFNSAAERMLGYRADEIIGRATPDIIHDPGEVAARARELSAERGVTIEPGFEVFVRDARDRGVDEREWTYIRKDGSKVPVYLSVTPLCSENGDVIGFMGIGADISEKKAIQSNLRETEERYRSLFNSASDAIFLMKENLFVDCNPATLSMFDCRRNEIIGRSPREFSPEYQEDGQRSEVKALARIDAAYSGEPQRFEWRHQTLQGKPFEAEVSLNVLRINEEPHLLASVRDITERKEFEDQLSYMALHDSLTGLLNRASLHQAFLKSITLNFDKKNWRLALLLLDLDRFKEINDTLGHHVGDDVLKQIGPRLQNQCENTECAIVRLGGDEFALLVRTEQAETSIMAKAHGIAQSLCQPFLANGLQVSVGASLGVALYPEHGKDSHELLRAADVAMYRAKKLSLGALMYDRSFDEHSTQRLAYAHELSRAALEDQLVLHYQPKIDLVSGATTGFEALVRWQHPDQGLLFPDSFIDLVEMSEVLHSFTRAVINIAVKDKKQLNAMGYRQPVAINLSARNLIDASCYEALLAALKDANLSAGEIEVELTESALMYDPKNAVELLKRFKQSGINIAVDDFGTGYSSLSYLRQFPVSALKIDREFVKEMLDNSQDRAIVKSTVALAHSLDLKVIAEGVENDEVLDLLKSMNCDQAQGFGICRPKTLDDLIQWMGIR